MFSHDTIIVPPRPEARITQGMYPQWNKKITVIVGTCVFVLINLLIASAVQKRQSFQSKAAVGQATISIKPAQSSLPPDGLFQIWISSDKPVVLAHIEFSFDPTLLSLQSEMVNNPENHLTKIVKNTTREHANSEGKMIVAYGLDPAHKSNPPSGTFLLGSFTASSKTTNSNISTPITLSESSIQIVDDTAMVFTVSVHNTTVTLNQRLPTPTNATSVQIDATPPTVTIITPANNTKMRDKGTMIIQADASDGSGISKIELSFDNQLIGTCVSVSSCSMKMNVNKVSNGYHAITARAVDNSTNRNTNMASIVVNK